MIKNEEPAFLPERMSAWHYPEPEVDPGKNW